MHPPRSPPEGGSGGSGVAEFTSNSSSASSGNDDVVSEAVLKTSERTASPRKYNSVSSTHSQYKKINKIFQANNNYHSQNSSVTNKRALKYKSSTVTEASLHHMKQRSRSTERTGGDRITSTIHHNSENASNIDHRESSQKYNQEMYNGDMANNRLMRNYSSYELNRKPNSNNSFSSSSSGIRRPPSITSSTSTTSHPLSRHPFTGKSIRSRSEDHLLHVSEDRDCCDGRSSKSPCEECGEESPFYLHDPSTVGYNRLSDLFPQTSSDDSGLCLNSSSHSPSTHSDNKRMTEQGFVDTNRLSEAYTNKTKKHNNINHKDYPSKNENRKILSRPRRAAPLPPIPVEANDSRNIEKRKFRGECSFYLTPLLESSVSLFAFVVFYCVFTCRTNTLQSNPPIHPTLTHQRLPVMEMMTIHQTVIIATLTVMRRLS